MSEFRVEGETPEPLKAVESVTDLEIEHIRQEIKQEKENTEHENQHV